MKNTKLVSSLSLIVIYCLYLIWDYFHHEMLARTVLKNMGWLSFLYPGGSFQYSWDLIILTPIFLGLLFMAIKKGLGFKALISFAIISIISGLLL